MHQQSLATLQKLSLCRSAQTELTRMGVLPWLLEFLNPADTLSEHCLEYGMALLMNLCLRSSGRRACEDLPVLTLLDSLIQVKHHGLRGAVAQHSHNCVVCKLSQRAVRQRVTAPCRRPTLKCARMCMALSTPSCPFHPFWTKPSGMASRTCFRQCQQRLKTSFNVTLPIFCKK